MIIGVKITQTGNCVNSSPESSSDDCAEDTHNVIDSPKLEFESALPSVVCVLSLSLSTIEIKSEITLICILFIQVISRNQEAIQFFMQLADFGCKLNNVNITEHARDILDQLPPYKQKKAKAH